MRSRFWHPREDRSGIWVRGERAAARAMRRAGCPVIARNVTVRSGGSSGMSVRRGSRKLGEVDLLCRERKTGMLVVVEVKARLIHGESHRSHRPESGITESKKRTLRILAELAARDRRWAGRDRKSPGVRIDVIAVEFEKGRHAPSAVRHYERAVSG